MNRLLIALLSALIATCPTPFVFAEDTHNEVAASRHLALIVCSVCHVVAPDEKICAAFKAAHSQL